MSGLLQSLLLTASLTPLCWIGVLMVVREMRKTGLVGPGLTECFDQLERCAWAVGGFLALLTANALSKADGGILKIVSLVASVGLICWLGVRMVVGRGPNRG